MINHRAKKWFLFTHSKLHNFRYFWQTSPITTNNQKYSQKAGTKYKYHDPDCPIKTQTTIHLPPKTFFQMSLCLQGTLYRVIRNSLAPRKRSRRFYTLGHRNMFPFVLTCHFCLLCGNGDDILLVSSENTPLLIERRKSSFMRFSLLWECAL